MNFQIKTPLRYPGGKSRALKNILPLVPNFKEFREPFLGGGSVFIALKQEYPHKKFWINDLNYNLYTLWKTAQDNLDAFVEEVRKIKDETREGRELHTYYTKTDTQFNFFERAVRFFILNRITFSGTADSGGYSQSAFKKRFTYSSIQRLAQLKHVLDSDIKITNQDYAKSITQPGDNVFIFLDPPYYTAMKSKLYGKNGNLHTNFDHARFAKIMKQCPHKWLITYDDSEYIKELFDFAYIKKWKLQYGMNNYKKDSAAKGNELFIANYPLEKQLDLIAYIKPKKVISGAVLMPA